MVSPFTSRPGILAWACAFLLAAVPIVARAQLSAPYEEPDLTTPVFDVNRLSLDAPCAAVWRRSSRQG